MEIASTSFDSRALRKSRTECWRGAKSLVAWLRICREHVVGIANKSNACDLLVCLQRRKVGVSASVQAANSETDSRSLAPRIWA